MLNIKKKQTNKQTKTKTENNNFGTFFKNGYGYNLKINHNNYSVLRVIVLRFQKNRSTRTKVITQKSLCLQTKFVESSAHLLSHLIGHYAVNSFW